MVDRLREIPEREDIKTRIKSTMESSQRTWRTVESMVEELQLDPIIIRGAVYEIEGLAHGYHNGQDVFTTADHWRKTTPWWRRMLSYIAGKYV